MKHHLTINFFKNTIEASTYFVKKAGVYGSYEYHTLMNVQREHPAFALKILPPKQKTAPIITYDFMRNYIVLHSENEENLNDFDKLVLCNANYFQVKKWFVEQYPIFKTCKSKEEWLLVA